MDIIREYPHLPWNRTALSHNRNIDISRILQLYLPNATGKWNWYMISRNTSMSQVISHPDLPWDREGLSRNKDISVEVICNVHIPNATFSWRMEDISSNN